MEDELEILRRQIDAIDAALVDFLNTRLDIVRRIGELKGSTQAPISDPGREAAILESLREQAKHPLLKENIGAILEPLFRCSKQMQKLATAPEAPARQVGIVGLGLLGSSIARALKLRGLEITAVDPVLGLELPDYVDQSLDNPSDLVGAVDLIILATPIETIPSLAKDIVQRARDSAQSLLLMDVASLKAEIAELFESLSAEQIQCIPTHPMAGSEKRGPQSGQASLFIDAPWIITPIASASQESLNAVEQLIGALGAQIVHLDAAEHDTLCALISHLPGVLASEYHGMVERLAPGAVGLAGPGYRSFTRIAHSNAEMRKQIARGNHDKIQQWLVHYLERIRHHAEP